MFYLLRKVQSSAQIKYKHATRLPNRAPTVAPARLLEVELLIEVELELLLAEVGSVEIGVVEALITEVIDAGLVVGRVSHWPIIE